MAYSQQMPIDLHKYYARPKGSIQGYSRVTILDAGWGHLQGAVLFLDETILPVDECEFYEVKKPDLHTSSMTSDENQTTNHE